MAFGKRGKRLEAARYTLLLAQEQAGQGAAALQKEINGLLTEIEHMIRQWFPDPLRVEDICAEANRLAASAPDSGKLNAEVARGTALLRAARDEMERLDDAAVSVRACERIDEWSRQVGNLNARVGSHDRSVERVKADVDRIAALIRRQTEAARKTVEARDVIGRVGKGGAKTAALELELDKFRDSFHRQEPTPESLEGFERILAPVRTAANTPPPPPPPPPASLQELRRLMPEARRWVEALAADRTPLGALEDRVAQTESGQPGAGFADTLRDDVRSFVAKLRAQAREERDDKFHRLSVDFGYYEEACGPDPHMSTLLASLRELDVEHANPGSFQAWREQVGKARSHFDGMAKAGAALMEGLCRKKVESCLTRLAAVRERNLLDEVRRGCDAAKVSLDQLGVTRGPAAVFAGLHTVGTLEDEVEKLDRRSCDDLESYSRSRDAALSRRRELDELAAQSGIRLLPIRILDTPPQLSLGRCRDLLDAFIDDIDAASGEFVRGCHAGNLDDHAFCEAAAKVLRTVPEASRPVLSSAPAVPDSPAAAAAQRAEYSANRVAFASVLVLHSNALSAEVKEIRAKLKDWRSDRPDDLLEAHGLVDDIDSGGYDTEADLSERVRALTEIRARCQNFFHRMDRDRREFEEKQRRIRIRWRRFTERDLKGYYPEYSTRITGLLMGVPPVPQDWKAASLQMDEIGTILDSVEKEALRRASADIEDLVRTLTRRLPKAPLENRREIQAVLDSLDPAGGFPDSGARHTLLRLRDNGTE